MPTIRGNRGARPSEATRRAARERKRRSEERAERRHAVQRALRARPELTDRELAREVGASPDLVRRTRDELGLPAGALPQVRKAEAMRAADAALLRERGGATVREFAGAVGVSPPAAGHRLRKLVDCELAVVGIAAGRGGARRYSATG